MGRAPCCDKANVKKGPWSPEEDSKLKSYIEQNGTGGNWIALPQKIGLKRCGKSCRLRWLNYLRPNIKHGGFSEEEDNIICSLYMSIGSRWSIIAAQLPGRTDNDIKNYWNTRLKKKLLGRQRKEQQSLLRRINSLKQEKKNENNYENLILPGFMNQTQYWSTQPTPVPILNSDQEPCFKDQTSLRNLLIKLGGRFSDHPFPVTNSSNQDFQSLTQFPTAQYDFNSAAPAIFPASGLHVDDLSYRGSAQLDGFDGFYGTQMIGGSSAANSGESSGWSEEMKAFAYPLMVSDYEACQQGIPQLDSAFEFGFQSQIVSNGVVNS